jgi:hypothetical protein
MTEHKWFKPAVIAIVVIALIVMGASAIQRSAWSQGYMMGQLAAGGEEGAVAPYAPYYPGGRGFGYYPGHHGSFLGGIFKIVMVGFFVFLIFKLLRRHAWKKAYWHKYSKMKGEGPPPEHWARHWQGHMPPWFWGEAKPEEEADQPAEEEAEAEADEA